MPSEVTAYRVLIELAPGLEDELRAFGETLYGFDESEAIPRDVLFVPLGWDPAASTEGLHGEDLEGVDYLVFVLWDRSPPGAEELWDLAVESERDPGQPLRQVVPMFKTVPPRQAEDPGEQLRRVLRFRERLDSERRRAVQFDDVDGFREALRRQLKRWLIDHEQGRRPAAVVPRHPPAPQEERDDAGGDHPMGDDPSGRNEYGLFLQRQGMLEEAETLHRQAVDAARERGDAEAEAVAYGNLGVIYQRRHDLGRAEEMLRKALAIAERLERKEGMAACFSGLGEVYRRGNELDRAEEMFRQALAIEEQLDRAEGVASCYDNLAVIYDFRRQSDKAEEMRRLARAVGEEPEYPRGRLFPRTI